MKETKAGAPILVRMYSWLRGIPVGVPSAVIGRFILPGTRGSRDPAPMGWGSELPSQSYPAIVTHHFQIQDSRSKIHSGSKIKIQSILPSHRVVRVP
jgi:hypothetical protein